MVDVQNFITPANKFEGLYRLADDVERRNERADLKLQKGKARRDNLIDDLLKYTDPKEFFTGTPQDPVITQSLKGILDKGAKMITDNEGLDNAMLYTALAPDINKLSTASQNLKQIEAQRKQAEPVLAKHTGIDSDQFNRQFKQNAYLNPDGSVKDLSAVDPQTDYVDYTLKNSDVYNNTGFDQFAKEAKPNTVIGSVKNTDPRGGFKKFRTELTSPNYTVSEKDAEGNHTGFAPKFEVATENGQPLLHEFTNPDGTKTTAPVRLLDKGIMNDLPPDAKAYLLQEQRKYAKAHNVPANSLQAENFARATAYDELNSPTKKWGTVKVLEETKAPQIKVYNNGSGKGAADKDGIDLLDAFKKINSTSPSFDVVGGVVKRKDGSNYTGEIKISREDVPADLENALKALNKEANLELDDVGRIRFKAKDGEIVSVLTSAGFLDRPSTKEGDQKATGVPAKNKKFEEEKKANLLQRAKNAIAGKGKKTYKGLDKYGNPIFE